jgi:hypothetical protein
MHVRSGVRARHTAMGTYPSREHHCQGGLQWLAHIHVPGPVRRLPGKPPLPGALRFGSSAHGSTRETHSSRSAAQHVPSGVVQPVMHQHADGTTIHAATTADTKVFLTSSVDVHCRATGTKSCSATKPFAFSCRLGLSFARPRCYHRSHFCSPTHIHLSPGHFPAARRGCSCCTALHRDPAEAQSPHWRTSCWQRRKKEKPVGTTDSHRGEHKNKQYQMTKACTTQRQADRHVSSCGIGRIPLLMLASLAHRHLRTPPATWHTSRREVSSRISMQGNTRSGDPSNMQFQQVVSPASQVFLPLASLHRLRFQSSPG